MEKTSPRRHIQWVDDAPRFTGNRTPDGKRLMERAKRITVSDPSLRFEVYAEEEARTVHVSRFEDNEDEFKSIPFEAALAKCDHFVE